MKRLHIIIYIGTLLLAGTLLAACDREADETADRRIESAIVADIQQRADLVTTEVRVRKLAIYDSNQHERLQLTDPRTWKYGERKCVVPVEVNIKYGYDLSQVGVDDVKLTDDSTAVVILLPPVKVIDSGYQTQVHEQEVVKMSSGLRDPIGHEEVEKMMKQAYETVMKEDYTPLIANDLENNARTLFTSLVKSLGLPNTEVVIHRKEVRP